MLFFFRIDGFRDVINLIDLNRSETTIWIVNREPVFAKLWFPPSFNIT